MQKKLSAILDSIQYTATAADGKTPLDENIIGATPIKSLAFDSRKVADGSLFFALPGTHTTGNKFIAKAIDNGANAIIYEGEIEHEDALEIAKAIVRRSFSDLADKKNTDEIVMPVFLKVENARLAMAPVSDAFFDSPSKKLIVIGVTGTEGKSSTVSFIWQLLRLAGKKAGFISTVQFSLGGEAIANPDHATTPEPPIIQHHLYQMVQAGCEYAVVESSSHGLSKKLGRLNNVLFDCGVFMNVTLEHLEFHKTFEQYRDDKANLFRALDEHSHEKTISATKKNIPSLAIVNLEDPSAEYFARATKQKVFGFTTGGEAGKKADLPPVPENISVVEGKNILSSEKDISFDMISGANGELIHVSAPLPGAFNAYNILAAITAVSGLTGIPASELASKAAALVPVTGRMTVINKGQPFEVIVDYAHTPSSFETIFPPVKKRCAGKIISLFGSGGERDLTKRPLQGQIAGKWCDTVILTDEDPRGEDSTALLKMISKGAEESGMIEGKNLFIIPDRKKAIREAFRIAQKNDIVLLLGKGHENSIIYKDYVMPYDEISEAEKALEEMGYKK